MSTIGCQHRGGSEPGSRRLNQARLPQDASNGRQGSQRRVSGAAPRWGCLAMLMAFFELREDGRSASNSRRRAPPKDAPPHLQSDRPPPAPPSMRVLISKLTATTTVNSLRTLLEPVPSASQIHILRAITPPAGLAFVETLADADAAVALLARAGLSARILPPDPATPVASPSISATWRKRSLPLSSPTTSRPRSRAS